MLNIKIGIVTVSDRASAGIYEDLSGKAIIDTLNQYLISEWEKFYEIIPDEREHVEKTIIDFWLTKYSKYNNRNIIPDIPR